MKKEGKKEHLIHPDEDNREEKQDSWRQAERERESVDIVTIKVKKSGLEIYFHILNFV